MKKISAAVYIIFTALLNLSCEENFSPKTDFKEKYFLFCIIQTDGTFKPNTQFAVINRLYDVEGLDPSANTQNTGVSGACVLLSYKGKNFAMNEATYKGEGRTGYDSSQVYYYCYNKELTPSPYEEVSVHARLPKNILLTGSTRVPEFIDLAYSYPFAHGITTLIDKFLWGKSWKITWQSNNNYLFFPRLTLSYTAEYAVDTYYASEEIPLKYINQNGKYSALYPGYSYERNVSYDFDAIDSVMKHISEGDSVKIRYKNFQITFTLKVFDKNLSKYYSGIHGSLDNYSIRFDESVYSNVNGGAGIVGSILNISRTFELDPYYLRSFGYTP